MIRRPPRSTLDRSSAASDVYKRQAQAVQETAAFIRAESGQVAPGQVEEKFLNGLVSYCLLYTSPSPRDRTRSRMPSSA